VVRQFLEDMTDDEAQFRAGVRGWASARVIPGSAERDVTGQYPGELIRDLSSLGAMGISVPETLGGLGLPLAVQLAAIEEVAFADAALASIYTAHYLAVEALRVGASVEQSKSLLPGLAAGGQLGAFALTEPDSGSDIASMRTRAQAEGDGWKLSGSKTFISNAKEADLLVVFAKTDPGAGFRGISCFAVPGGSAGLNFSDPQDKCGLRSAPTYTVFLDEVAVPREALLGALGAGGKIALQALNGARIDIAAMATGIAARALHLAVEYATSRQQFGSPLAGFQAIQLLVGEMWTLLRAARLSAWAAAARKDRGLDIREDASMAKYLATENCFRVVDHALQIHGGTGYMRETEIERLYRDCRVLRIYEGTSQIQLLGIGRAALRSAHAG